jgi:hypothetical protein
MRRLLSGLFLLVVLVPILAAQGTTDVITGQVTNDRDLPVAEALVEAFSLESQITRSARTNAKGRYTIVFPDGGGQYRITIRSIGSAPFQRLVARQADEDRLVVNVKLSSVPVVLEELRARARRPMGEQQGPGPGATERVIPSELAARLPIDASDLVMLATLAPGVVLLEATDSTPLSLSIAGQRPTANNVTLDGLTFGASSVPQDAIRATRVITTTYDPARGQFSGGQIASTTRSGTNRAQGSANYSFRDRELVVSSTGDDAFASGFSQHQLSFGFGGPIKRDRLFVFGSALGRFRGDQLQSVLSATPASLGRLGVAPDSVTRLLGVLGSSGVPIDTDLSDASRSNDEISSLLRLDYLLSSSQTLTVRGDFRHSRQEPTRVGPLSVPSGETRSSQRGGGAMVSLSSRFGPSIVNELRAYLSASRSAAPATLALPAGRVQIVSLLPDQARGATSLSFGGVTGLPQRSSSSGLEMTEEFSWIPGSGAHRIKLGGLLNLRGSEDDAAANRFGTFVFSSLADLEADRPASFSRTLSPRIRETRTTNAALYFADTWRVREGLQLTYGLRAERSVLGGAPAYNPAVDQTFGIRTDRWPSETRVSPRAGFSWFTGANGIGPPKWILRGGVGEFRSPVPGGLLSAAQAAPGLGETESQLVCIGAAAPAPDWAAYLLDPEAIPTACLAAGPPIVTQRPAVTAFASRFEAPRAWRGSLGVQRRVGLAMVGLEVSHARGVSQFGVRDRNLGPARFTLPGENRPVFAPAAAIDPRTGAVPLFASRQDQSFGNVLLFDSELGSRTTQVTVSANGATRQGAFFNLSYTWNRSRDQSSFSFGPAQRGFSAATTAGDPNQREWATSDFERRHSIQGSVTYPITSSFEITTIVRASSGAPFTPLVNEDVNGDGSRNDRAFVFAPTAADTAVAGGMARILAGGSAAARSCLARELGRIAGRNVCRGPWQTSLDFQFNLRPRWVGLERRLAVSVVTSNLLVGIDELVHGRDGLRGWGQAIRPDATLLVVRGFDPVTLGYHYTVNERFGASGANTIAIRQPFQVGLQLRYTLGPDPIAQFRNGLRGGGPGGGGRGPNAGAGPTGPGMVERFTTMMPNPARQIVEIRVALNLSDSQVTRLTQLGDSLAARTKELGARISAAIEKAGPNPDPGVMFGSIRPLFEAGRQNHGWALREAQSILTKEQWDQVPERIKTLGSGMGGRDRRP